MSSRHRTPRSRKADAAAQAIITRALDLLAQIDNDPLCVDDVLLGHAFGRHCLTRDERKAAECYLAPGGERTCAEWDALPDAVQAALNYYTRLVEDRERHEEDPRHVVSDACSFCRADASVTVSSIR